MTSMITNAKKKEYQFTVRIPDKLKKDVYRRMNNLGFNALAEYIRFLMANDIYSKGDNTK